MVNIQFGIFLSEAKSDKIDSNRSKIERRRKWLLDVANRQILRSCLELIDNQVADTGKLVVIANFGYYFEL